MNITPVLILPAWLTLAAQVAPPPRLIQAIPISGTLVEDAEMAKVIRPYAQTITDTFEGVLTEAPHGLARAQAGEENLLGYWVADLMRARASELLGTNVKFAITNTGGLRANLRPGLVKVGSIYEVMPFENEMVTVEFTGAEIIQIVKEGILRRSGEPLSGVTVALAGSVEAPALKVTWADGSPIEPHEVVKVATTDYLAANGDGVATLRQGRKLFTTGIQLRQLLLDECTRLGMAHLPLLPPAGHRYAITPELLAALKERKLKW